MAKSIIMDTYYKIDLANNNVETATLPEADNPNIRTEMVIYNDGSVKIIRYSQEGDNSFIASYERDDDEWVIGILFSNPPETSAHPTGDMITTLDPMTENLTIVYVEESTVRMIVMFPSIGISVVSSFSQKVRLLLVVR